MQKGVKLFRTIISICVAVSFVLISGLTSCHSSGENQQQEENTAIKLLSEADKIHKSDPALSLMLTDSVMKIARESSITDTILLKLYLVRAKLFSNAEKVDSVIACYQRACDLAVAMGDSLNLAQFYRKLGDLQTQFGSIKLAEKDYLKSTEIYEKMGRKYDAALSTICYTQLLSLKGNFDLSQKKLMEVYQLLDKMDSLEAEISVFNGIGNNFADIGNYRQAIVYFMKSYQTAMKFNDYNNALVVLNNAGTCYLHIESDSALVCFQQALEISTRLKNPEPAIMVKYNIGNFRLKKKQYQQAAEIFGDVLNSCRKEKLTDGVARAYSGLAEIAENTGNLTKAAELCGKAIAIADSTGRMVLKLALMQQNYQIIRKLGDCNAALLLSEEIKILADSIMNSEKQHEIYKLERQYQSDKTDLENSNLKLEVASQAARLSYRQNFMIAMIFAILALSVLLFLLYRTFRERSMAYTVLIGQYEEERIQRKNLRYTEEATARHDVSDAMIDEEFEESGQLLLRLQNYFEQNKPHLDPKLRVDMVAEALNVTPKAIASALKGSLDNNFNLFINRYRIETAKTLLEDPVSRHYKIDVIAMNSGFGTKQSFYNAFEQFTGIKPSYYREHIMTIPSQPSNDTLAK
jgi:tetratricopeptide (TPR) repeat protein/AraC-like DNA-binding protein